jgi:hypothetical protein
LAVIGLFSRGDYFSWTGNAQEFLFYVSDETSNRSGIETNINDHYDIYTPFTTGLLDDYGGAAAAYSLRRLSSTYTGDAIRVRRASDNAEQDIGFDIEGNLDTAALASFCSGTNGFVKTWYCQSGNSNDATQTTVTQQPKIYDSSTGVMTENGKPAIDFDGANDYMQSQSNYTPTASMAISMVCRGDASSTDQMIGDTGDRKYGMSARIQAGYFNYFNGQTGNFTSLTQTATSSQELHLWGRQTGSLFYARTSGSQVDTAISAADTTALPVIIGARSGGSLPFDGTIQSVIVWTVDVYDDRTGIETNINDFYSIF